MPHASSRPAGAPSSGGTVAGSLSHRFARVPALALLLVVLPLQLATGPTEFRELLTGTTSASPAHDIPLCC
ncbi:hypothetical protein [Streptomyces sp. NPDC040750]|uniref:hypothetical protein n=1 Tax=Streptomyces sp. NPDC040750 TaxID=3154491 RepID=UPI00340241AF